TFKLLCVLECLLHITRTSTAPPHLTPEKAHHDPHPHQSNVIEAFHCTAHDTFPAALAQLSQSRSVHVQVRMGLSITSFPGM
ncbi:hypothetical protein BC826DRAFT_1027797, partial [Russula brevipes]